MESIFSTIFYYILVPLFILGVAINIHELGHFLVAKFFGMRVEAYSFFGLGPRVWGIKYGHTDYRISAIPLGAYVKLYGDEATASLEGGESAGEKVPDSELYELRPRWQKFLVMLGGPFMNIVLALSIPFTMALVQGVPSMPAPVIGAIKADSSAAAAGFQTGDRIVVFNGAENPTWRQIQLDAAIYPEKPVPVVVERNGQRVGLEIVPRKETIMGGQRIGPMNPRLRTARRALDPGPVMIEGGIPTAKLDLDPGQPLQRFLMPRLLVERLPIVADRARDIAGLEYRRRPIGVELRPGQAQPFARRKGRAGLLEAPRGAEGHGMIVARQGSVGFGRDRRLERRQRLVETPGGLERHRLHRQ